LLLTQPSFSSPDINNLFVHGIPVSNGAANGILCTNKKHIDQSLKNNQPIIYFSRTISSDEILFLDKISGLVAVETDPSSHAAIICKDKGLPFISKISNTIIISNTEVIYNQKKIEAGNWISIDAFSGNLYSNKQELTNPAPIQELMELLEIIEKTKRLKVFGNADTPSEVKLALENGAEGVEPRTEHMFYNKNRLMDFQKIIILNDKKEIDKVLKRIEKEQIKDFSEILSSVKGLPALIRLIDPPLHEFLPTDIAIIKSLAKKINISYTDIINKINELKEVNPMSGHRGVRLLITYPEIAEMQVRALFKAAVNLHKIDKPVTLRIVIPMVVDVNEILVIKQIISKIHSEIEAKSKFNIKYKIGIMVETPRAVFNSSKIAKTIDFFSFGTNDLTAFVFGFSRGDVYEKFLIKYLERKILKSDPFITLDKSVSKLISITVKAMVKNNCSIESSICGEQSTDEKTIKFCDSIGMTSISCNPPKILSSKLFAAKAAILNNKK
jgi:pyruvate,orthophosphate dikinase